MKKILYIHGYKGSANGGTSQNIKKLLKNRLNEDFEIIAPGFSVENPEIAKKQVEEASNEADIVIGSSMGGFYTLNCVKGKPCIVINPCMKPQEVYKRFWDSNEKAPTQEIENLWKTLDSSEHPENIPAEEKSLKFGIFASEDELFHYKDLFDSTFGLNNNSVLVGGPHPLGDDIPNLTRGLEAALKWYNLK